jgi:predicted O-methyltransferase YrrM
MPERCILGVLGDARIEGIADRLYVEAEGEDPDLDRAERFVALDRPKAAFCYLVCRALNARLVVEAGTSFGVSTLFLATAVRDNGGGSVIATEHEPAKAARARTNFAEAGLEQLIDLREGDLRDTLRDLRGNIDFMLVDIWTPMALPALTLVAPHLRSGAAVVCDNTEAYGEAYRDYLSFVRDPHNGFRSMVLPFSGGLEMSIRVA